MIAKLYNSALFKGKEVVGLHIHLLPNSTKYVYCKLENNRSNLVVLDKAQLDSITETDLSKLPFYFSIDGAGIMHFKLQDAYMDNPLDQVLPNAKEADYYIQKVNVQDDLWVSFLRKDLLDQLIRDLEQISILPIKLTLGAFELSPFAITEVQNNHKFEYKLFQNKWEFENGKLVKVVKDESNLEASATPIEIAEDLELAPLFLLPFFNGLAHFGVETAEVINQPEVVIGNKKEYIQKRLFILGGWAALIFCLVLLFANFLLFDYYNNKLNQVQQELSAKNINVERIDELEKEVAEKKVFFERSGLISPEKIAFKADRIAATVPRNILLDKLEINPSSKKKLKADESPSFQLGEIIIKGETKESIHLNDWVQELNAFDWVSKVDVVDYETIKNRSVGKFSIKLTVN